MAITVGTTEIIDFLTAQPVDWLLANVGDKIRIKHNIRVEEFVLANSDNPFTMNDTDGIGIGGGWLTDPANRFINYEVGDTVILGNYVTFTDHGSATIIAKNNNGAIQLSSALGFGNDVVNAQFILSLANPITAMKYYYNFIENNEAVNFFSKVDGSEQLMAIETVDAATPGALPMLFLGPKPYQIGNATIEGFGIFDGYYYFSSFEIIHETFVTPLMLATQLLDAQNGLAPTYFQNQNCFKYVYKLDALYNYLDPNRLLTLTVNNIQGDSGWFNERFNSGVTNYSIDDVNYSNASLAIIPKLELTQANQYVDITVKNTTDTPFVNGQTKFVLNFAKCPFDASEYQGNTRDQRENFVFDRAQSVLGAVVVNGELNAISPAMRVMMDVKAVFNSSSEIVVSCRVNFGNDSFAIINESNTFYYMFWVTVENHILDTDSSDKVSLLVGPSEYYINTDDQTMVIINNLFLRHFEEDPDTEGVSEPHVFPNDEVIAFDRFHINTVGRENDTILLKSLTMKVKAKNSVTLDEIILDVFSQDISTAPIINGWQWPNAPQAAFQLPRPFHIPVAEELRKHILIQRRDDLDSAGLVYYDAGFPFLVRWEYWLAQANNNGAFFDINEPQSGWNKFWHRYAGQANWGLYYEFNVVALKNGVTQSYTSENAIPSHNFGDNPDWTLENIKAFDPDTLVELFDGVKKYLQLFKDNLIQANFTYSGADAPLLSDIAMNIRVEAFEEGGRDESRRISSVWVAGDTWFKSTDTSNKVVLSSFLPTGSARGECLLDGTQMPQKAKWTIYARLYDMRQPVGAMCGIMSRRQEDEICRLLENGNARNTE